MEELHWWKEWPNIWFSEICQLNWGVHSCLCYYWIPMHLGIQSAQNVSWKWTTAKGLRMMTKLGQFQPQIVSHGPSYGKLQDSPAVAAWPSANVMDLSVGYRCPNSNGITIQLYHYSCHIDHYINPWCIEAVSRSHLFKPEARETLNHCKQLFSETWSC